MFLPGPGKPDWWQCQSSTGFLGIRKSLPIVLPIFLPQVNSRHLITLPPKSHLPTIPLFIVLGQSYHVQTHTSLRISSPETQKHILEECLAMHNEVFNEDTGTLKNVAKNLEKIQNKLNELA